MSLPYLLTIHNTYTVLTPDYVHPTMLHSYKKYKRKRGTAKKKSSFLKRNSRVIQIGHAVKWKTFLTLTFSPEFYWKDYDYIQSLFRKFVKSLYYRCGKVKYLAVLEHGKENNRLHYHMLTDIKFKHKIFEHAFHTKRKVCNIWDWGFSDVVGVNNKNCNAVYYLAKYLNKDDKNRTPIGKREVFSSRGLNKVIKIQTHFPWWYIDNMVEYVKVNKSIVFVKKYEKIKS